MRASKLVVLLGSAACALVLAQAADATSVILRFINGTGGTITGLGTSTVTVSSSPTTLTLDIQLDTDAAGVSSAFFSLEFDRDLRNELDIVSFQELSWTNAMMNMQLNPFTIGILGTVESDATDTGVFYTFDGTTLDDGPASVTLTFARVVFVTNPSNLARDGGDIFAYIFNVGVDGLFNNAGNAISTSVFPSPTVTFASVNSTGAPPAAVQSLYADFDKNTRADILVFDSATRGTWEFLMSVPANGTAPLGTSTAGPTVPVDWVVVGIADVSGDQQADVILYTATTRRTYVFEMRGGVVLDSGPGPSLPDISWAIAGVGDFNNDQLADILALQTTTGGTYQFHLDGRQAGVSVLGSSTAGPGLGATETIIGIGQFDGLNGDDMLTADSGGVTRQYHLDTTGGQLGSSGGSVVIPAGWGAAAVGDFDNNGLSDLLVVEASSGAGYFFLLNGLAPLGSSGVFNRAAFLPTGWDVGTVGDFNADGSSDVVIRNIASRTLYLYLISGTSASASSGFVTQLPAATWSIPVSNQANL